MRSRKPPDQRCQRCKMRLEGCICNEIPSLDLATKVLLIISKREVYVPTNTGRLAALALKNSVILTRGDQANPYDLSAHLRPGHPQLLLYPGDDAPLLTAELLASYGTACDLVVPDGNWRQASKMRRRDPHMATMPVVRLPPGPPTAYRVRKETKDEGLATIEAIARALGILEGPAAQLALEGLLDAMVRQTLRSRGTLL